MGIFGHDTYPAFFSRGSCLKPGAIIARKKICGTHQKTPDKKPAVIEIPTVLPPD
jgi:hypothetical protein